MFAVLFVRIALVFTSFGASAHALAVAKNYAPTHVPTRPLDRLASMMPHSSLATPAGQLKYVVLGLGTQNYTCASGDELAAPGTTGATATLYDVGSRLSVDLPAAKWKIPAISGLALHLSVDHEALEGFFKLEGYDRVIGHHFFRAANGTSTPVFAFDQLSLSPYPIAQVRRANGAEAPKTAYPGLQREGAVPWLRLVDTGSSVGGVDTVYRLETAGGKGPGNCQGRKGAFEVKYAAQSKRVRETYAGGRDRPSRTSAGPAVVMDSTLPYISCHSAGAATASLLYTHVLSGASSPLATVANDFTNVHCILFGCPPITLHPLQDHLQKDDRLSRSLFLSFLNEGDPIIKADAGYILAKLPWSMSTPPDVRPPRKGGEDKDEILVASIAVKAPKRFFVHSGRVFLLAPNIGSPFVTRMKQVDNDELDKKAAVSWQGHGISVYKARIESCEASRDEAGACVGGQVRKSGSADDISTKMPSRFPLFLMLP
ncbi:hypothetical protein DDE83_001115 [Stemphylium lycopersici]|uniref:Uncharacterized protein n=1 Tax=Stemphylium lycopersici TaxID=183478 RepID=A0A364NDT4_STELY|nr:hypothetical protein DDE83_001115 [Stemphylium lycopersici]